MNTALGADKLQEAPLNIGILDIDKVFHESKVGRYIQEQMQTKRSELQNEIEGYEEVLRKDEKELKDLQANSQATSKEIQDKQVAFEEKVNKIQTIFSEKGRVLEESFNVARGDVIQTVMKLVATISDERKISIVIPKSVVMFRDEAFEFTNDLIKRLDKELPIVTIKLKQKD